VAVPLDLDSVERQSPCYGYEPCLILVVNRLILCLRVLSTCSKHLLGAAVGPVLITTEVVRLVEHAVGELVWDSPRTLGLKLERVVSLLDTDVTHLAPVLTPGVPDDPVLLLALRAPADNGDDVVDLLTCLRDNASLVFEDRGCIDTTCDRSASHDLLGHVVCAFDGAVLRDGGVRVVLDRTTEAGWCEGGASTGHVLRGAVPLDGATDAICHLRGARHVRVGSVVGDTGVGRGGQGMKPLVWPVDGASVAASDATTVEDVLNGEIDVDALSLAGDLDAIAEGGD